jgi:hypothetical protein
VGGRREKGDGGGDARRKRAADSSPEWSASMTTYPKKQFVCRNVGELKAALKRVPNDIRVEMSFGKRIELWHAVESKNKLNRDQIGALKVNVLVLEAYHDDDD